MRTFLMTAALCIGAACGGAAIDTYVQAAPRAIEIESAAEIPAGTDLLVSLRAPLGARVNGVGDRVAVDVVRPLASRDKRIVVPIGTTIHGTVTSIARPATRGNQVAIAVRFDELMHRGRARAMTVEVVDVQPEGVSVGRSFGTVLSPEEALAHTGIEAGGDAGSVVTLGMGEVEPLLPAGTRLTLETSDAVRLR